MDKEQSAAAANIIEGSCKEIKTEDKKDSSNKKNSEELKTRSIRFSDSTIEEFKSLMEKNNWSNQNQTMQNLIDSFELANAQFVLTNRQAEIEDYNLHIHRIISAYTKSLELAECTEERINLRMEEINKERDKEVRYLREQSQNYQDEIKKIKEENKNLKDDLNRLSEQNVELKERLKHSMDNEKKKDDIIESFTKLNPKSDELEAVITAMKQEAKSMKKHTEQLEQANRELTNKLSQAELEYIAKAKSDLQELEVSRKEVQDLRNNNYNLSYYYNLYMNEHPEVSRQQSQQQV